MAKLLIIDDEPKIRESLKSALDRRGHETVTAEGYIEGRKFAAVGFDLIFLDVMLPDGNGIDLLKEIKASNPDQQIVMISGQADIEVAVSSIQLGAYDFIEKPISLERVIITIENAVKTARLTDEKNRLSSALYGEFIGESEPIRKLKNDITASAPRTNRFLITGENGTGKELVAHMIHRLSQFSNGPFIAINCAALPHELIESELFGHTKGSFTGATKDRRGKFEEASGGSIFLDEISEMPSSAQAKILRTLESHLITPVGSNKETKVECNVIAASNRNLETEIKAGNFRTDLYYRLNVVQFHLPPLRERIADLLPLTEHFLSRFATQSGMATKKLTAKALNLLKEYPFPGNIRELRNLLERLHIYISGTKIELDDIKSLLPGSIKNELLPLKEAVGTFEYEYIKSTLNRCEGNVAKAARILGLERSHLYKKLRKFDSA